jgi:hypothetical protein
MGIDALTGSLEEAFGPEFNNLSIYQLGIGPYINASWIMSLATQGLVPLSALGAFAHKISVHLQQLRQAGGEVRPLVSSRPATLHTAWPLSGCSLRQGGAEVS